jgi:sulfide:quinone oxidoreductase
MEASPKKSISKFCGHSEGQGVAQFLPEENAVVLKNGRKIQYEQLVIATGLKNDTDIAGVEDAWNDQLHPFYFSIDHPSWRTTANKSFRYYHNFQGGESIFYIPPYPFHTEI